MSQIDRYELNALLKGLRAEMDCARADEDFSTVHHLQQQEQRIEALLIQ